MSSPPKFLRETVSRHLSPLPARDLYQVNAPVDGIRTTDPGTASAAATSGSWSPTDNFFSRRLTVPRAIWPARCDFSTSFSGVVGLTDDV
ncbi:hypothetical protein EVAR_34003_1 [Eumeta japonica]|uniref:Uncharacterized protein n=1 Tax=Eumeta variegata TaxID=151549 RepID=A0A4C1VSB6_EUMVA|nr:hypothetical protein EVAR_34003_1 [Eumeta japonica]